MANILFTVDSFNHGCTGRKYTSTLEAIKDDSWDVWNETRRFKLNYKNETQAQAEKRFRDYCKMNHTKILTEKQFRNITKNLPEDWQVTAQNFINRQINLSYEL